MRPIVQHTSTGVGLTTLLYGARGESVVQVWRCDYCGCECHERPNACEGCGARSWTFAELMADIEKNYEQEFRPRVRLTDREWR